MDQTIHLNMYIIIQHYSSTGCSKHIDAQIVRWFFPFFLCKVFLVYRKKYHISIYIHKVLSYKTLSTIKQIIHYLSGFTTCQFFKLRDDRYSSFLVTCSLRRNSYFVNLLALSVSSNFHPTHFFFTS